MPVRGMMSFHIVVHRVDVHIVIDVRIPTHIEIRLRAGSTHRAERDEQPVADHQDQKNGERKIDEPKGLVEELIHGRSSDPRETPQVPFAVDEIGFIKCRDEIAVERLPTR